MINKYIVITLAAIFIVFTTYFFEFYIIKGYGFSDSQEVWGALGEYVGGVLSPILSFISIVLLIHSLNLQNEANRSLRDEAKNNEKIEKIKSFETIFFNMINAQREVFSSFRLDFSESISVVGADAVIKLEDKIEEIVESTSTNKLREIEDLLGEMDSKDKIFGVTRSFYIIVKAITERLSDLDGFGMEDRKSHYRTLVNFTEFSQLRLILISLQFTSFYSSNYLKEHNEFLSILEEFGLPIELYSLN